MRTKRKPAKKRFLALFLCLSMVISMMNVGGNVWADEPENTVKADTNDTADIDKKINPIYTLQHYFWFPEVQMGQVGDPVSGDQMAIINTDGRGVPKDRNEAATMVVPLSLKQDDSGQMTVDTKPQLKKMFEDEEVHFLEKPRMIYMNRLYDSDSDIDDEENLEEHFNENYTLKEVWVHQPEYGAILEGITPEEEKNYFVVYESPTQVINGITRHDPAKFVFTNNPNHPDVVNQPERQPGGEPVEAGEGDDFRHTILIKEGTIIRLIFDTTKGTKTVGDNVKFFDYDITSGVIYKNWNDINVGPSYKTSTQDDKTTYFADAWRKGINHPNNYDHPQDTEEDRKYAKYAFGNSSTTVLTGWGDQVWTPEGSSVSKYINRANDDTDSIVKKASYGLVEGLHNDGTLRWSRYIDAPAVFGDAPLLGKTNYTNNQFKLVFNREGGTYTLSAVNYENGDIKRTTTDNLEYFVSRPTWDKKGILWSNDFWPMDIGKAENGSWGTDGHDLKFGREDLSGNRKFGEGEKAIFPISDDKVNDHNPYFGMTFNVDFVVDPGYVAPLRYFFFGDDDMWVFLSKIKTDENGNEVVDVNGRAVIDENTTKLIADIGGVHQSIGEYVDLWDDGYVEQIPYRDAKGNPNKSVKYRLTFYYTERGASGSTCYMRFSLPFQSLVTKSPSYENELQIEKSVESMDPTSKDDLFAFQLNLYNKYGVELSNQYYYQRFKRSNDPNKSDTEIGTTHDNIMTTGTTFYLRDGEYIKVKNLPAGTTYHVKELNNGIGADGQPKEYSSTTFYTGTIQGGLEDIRIEGNEVSGRVDDESNIELPKINYVTYVNALNPGVLTLKKQMTGENIPVGQHHFKFNVTLTDSNDNPVQKVSWMKYLSDDNDRPDAPMEKQEDLENAEGKYVFELESKEKIMLYNLPVGTKYTITEESDDHFPLNKVEVNGSRVPSDNNTINGSIGDDPTRVEVVFTNTAEVSIEKSQAKVTDTGNEDFTTDILTVKKGDIIAYRLTVKNNSKVPINGLTVEDEIPYDNNGGNRLTLVQGSINEGGELQSDNKTILWEIPTLDPGKEVNLQFKVEVTEIGESQSWKNIAVLKEPGEPDEPSNPVYIVPKLEIKKDQSRNGGGRTTDTLGVNPGDEVTYYITVTNNSKGDAKDVTVTDEIPLSDKPEGDEKYRLENPVSIKGRILGTDKVFGGEREGDIIKWDLFDLAAGQTAELEFTVTVPDNGYHWKNIGYVSYTPDVKPDPNDPDAPKPEPTPPEPTNEVEIEKGIVIQKAQRLNDEDNFETNSLIVKEGSVITYQITVKNDRDTIVRDLVIEDEIPLDDTGSNRLTLVENSITAGGVLEGTVIKWKIPELAPQKEQKLEFKVKVEKIGESQSWKNIAILKEPDKPDKPSNPVYEVPNLEIRKDQSRNGENRTTDTLTVKAGDKVTYYITVSNNSKGDTKDVTVTDEIPLNILPETDRNHRLGPVEEGSIRGVVHETGQAFEGSQDGNVIKWDKFDLKAGQTATLRFTVSVPQGGYHWKNVGYVSYTPDIKPDPDDPNPQKPEPTKPEPTNEVEIEKPEISIRKTQYVGDDSNGETEKLLNVKPGDVITYCLTVNNGSDKDATDVIVTDRIPEGLTLVDGSISDGGTVGSDNVIAWKLGTLKAHESKKVRFKTVVPQVDKAAKWTNIAYVTSGDPDPDPEEDPKIPSNPVEAIPGIKIEKTQQVNGEGEPTKDLLHVKKDDKVTYYLTITNTSDATAFDVEVKDRVPEDNAGNQLELIGDSVQGGINHNVNGRDITWKLGDLKAGESQTVEFTVIVPAGGTYWINGASTSFVPPDPENPEKPGPEEDRTPDIPSNEVEIEKPDIRIRKTQYVGNNADEATDKLLSVKPGDVITYRLTVTNGSDKNATDVIVTDQIPEGLTLVNGSVSDGGTVGSDDIITWKLGTLGGGESKTVQFKATVPQVDEAAIWRNIAYVTSGNPDPDPEEDPKTP
ncbi:MAG: DUF11 domain-containing protein, partial [Hungatella sp.]|nr:DUF11 domain-containing protein [Hungatella sp.]